MIGIFDSGVGGLSVLNEIRRLLPSEPILYFADTKYLPYGEKTQEFLRGRSLEISRFLKNSGVKLLVIACNTATAAGAEYVRTNMDIPVVAVEPAIKPAVALSGSGVIGVLATEVTMESERFRHLVVKYAGDIRVIERISNDLVPLVETFSWKKPEGQLLLKKVVKDFVDEGVDAVVLGSTHFGFLKESLIELSAGKLVPVGSAEATAQQALKMAKESDAKLIGEGPVKILVSGDVKLFAENFSHFSNCQAEISAAPDSL